MCGHKTPQQSSTQCVHLLDERLRFGRRLVDGSSALYQWLYTCPYWLRFPGWWPHSIADRGVQYLRCCVSPAMYTVKRGRLNGAWPAICLVWGFQHLMRSILDPEHICTMPLRCMQKMTKASVRSAAMRPTSCQQAAPAAASRGAGLARVHLPQTSLAPAA
jgi:hypothetical protein